MHAPEFPQLRSLPSLDAEYRFGRPKVYLAPHELARLTLLRSRLGDTRAEREAEHLLDDARPASRVSVK
jgi:hypothetical protein